MRRMLTDRALDAARGGLRRDTTDEAIPSAQGSTRGVVAASGRLPAPSAETTSLDGGGARAAMQQSGLAAVRCASGTATAPASVRGGTGSDVTFTGAS